MSVFISHSFADTPEFDNVADALRGAHVPFWDPATIRAGLPLREQLRAAVDECRVCVFIATRRSLASSWCGAELGAFWGARKPLLVYLAEPSLEDSDLPPLVQGDVWERRLTRLVRHAKDIVAGTRAPDPLVSLTPMQLQDVVASAVAVALASLKTPSRAAPPAVVTRAIQHAARTATAALGASGFARLPDQGQLQRLLWVDDHAGTSAHERQALTALGFDVVVVGSPDSALSALVAGNFAAIVSHLPRDRANGFQEMLQQQGIATPFLLYGRGLNKATSAEARGRGSSGIAGTPAELVMLVVRALEP